MINLKLLLNCGSEVAVVVLAKVFMVFIAIVSLMLAVSSSARADDAGLLQMSAEIVDDYKTLRAECAAESDSAIKQMCFYKLHIKTWDYQQAREYLAQYKKPLTDREMKGAYALSR